MSSQSPLTATAKGTRSRKRLIVLCDGTWQDSTDDKTAYPTNVTRLARALKQSARVRAQDGTEEMVDQIVHYQQGVGTHPLDRFISGITGIGVSAHVRSAYGFLANNYDGDAGDEIYFFGFSRGAYIARSVAGLVTAHGLLTKKGMDSFSELYRYYYRKHGNATQAAENAFAEELAKKGLLDTRAAEAVKIVGVWDTVAFHQTWFAKTTIAKLMGIGQEYIEFHNTKLSEKVKYGFHALALDEHRKSFLPTLWDLPPTVSSSNVEMHQVWFSGEHSDIGGGRPDHWLTDITLAWMISLCKKTGLLEFDDNYLLQGNAKFASNDVDWDTKRGKTHSDNGGVIGNLFWKLVGLVDREPLKGAHTNEKIHCSIVDRKFGSNSGGAGARTYPCPLLTGRHENGEWQLQRDPNKRLEQTVADDVETLYEGRIRSGESLTIERLRRA